MRPQRSATLAANPPSRLARRLGTVDAIVVGLGAMVGAGIFASFAPAAQAAGAGLLLGLGIAACVAYCNAISSARLATRYPESGGTYVYARERLGRFWGYLAGWAFVIGKVASCAAISLTFGHYVDPGLARPLAIAAVGALTAVNLGGIDKTAGLTRAIVAVVLLTLLAFVTVALVHGNPRGSNLSPLTTHGVYGVLQAGSYLFFAFAGYARIATLGEEVVDPARTIGRAIPIALALTLALYAVVALAALGVAGPRLLAATPTPLKAVLAAKAASYTPVVTVGAAVGSLGVLLSLLAGVSRTAFAMARNGELPGLLGTVSTRRIPQHAELAVAVVVAAVVAVADIRGAIGFSSFCVLGYYALANVSAWTLRGPGAGRLIPLFGLVGCVALACALPLVSVLSGIAVLVLGVAAYGWLRLRAVGNGSEPE